MTAAPAEPLPRHRRPVTTASRAAQKFDVAMRAPYALSVAGFAAILIVITVMNHPAFAWDFRAFYDGGRQYLHMHSPYVAGSLAQLTTQQNFVYPLPFAALLAPLGLVPYVVAATLFIVAGAALLVLAIWLLGVRDWRVYAAVAIAMPTATAIGLGTITPLLTFLLALLWRYRDRPKVAAPVLALLILAKVFLWPVGLWLLFTRRSRTVGVALIGSLVAVLLSALPLGFGVLAHYPSLLRSISALEGPTSFSLSSLVTALGGSSHLGLAATIAMGLLLVLAMFRIAQRRDDQRVFRLSIVTALALSPIVWNHYLVLLYVPLALTRPRFSPAWLAGAWVLGVGVLDGRALAIVSAGVWIVILIQGGVVTGMVRRGGTAMRFLRPTIPFGSSVLQWAALLWLLGALTGAVPGVAALTPTTNAGPASGTARLHLDKVANTICWKILTSGLPARTRAQIVETYSHGVLVERPMTSGRSVGCAAYAAPNGNLAMPYKHGRARLMLRVTSTTGKTLLSGTAFPTLEQLKLPPSVTSQRG
jgi:hypothetical protein